ATPRRVRWEIDSGLEAFAALGVRVARFRPPAGIKNPWLKHALRERGLDCIGWSARGLEHLGGGAERVARRVTRALTPGSILLMHEGPRVPGEIRVEAIRRVLETLRERDYRCVVPGAEQLV
ncbi:MAG TPA: polysaccharide deacetylase family protein, partial [Lacunisphaera sp.]|nr:polysaccharide deacetylase family protein [Lacunisphaera sp.]